MLTALASSTKSVGSHFRALRAIHVIGLTAAMAAAGCASGVEEPLPGRYRAWLETPGGELPFVLELESQGAERRAFVINGDERVPASSVGLGEGRVRIGFAHYDAQIDAAIDPRGDRMQGVWTRTTRSAEPARLVFHAVQGDAPRFAPLPLGGASRRDDFAGRWSCAFASESDPAIGLFEARGDDGITGTFLTPTGDKRFLEGRVDGAELRVSGFDGGQALLVHARLLEDGTMAGEIWYRDAAHDTFTARRDDDARLPDPFSVTQWVDGVPLDRVEVRDLSGRTRTLADPEFAGAARVIEVFGTWCPNCGDSAALLAELDATYRDRGLSIVGIAFEISDDFPRSVRQVSAFRDRYGLGFPLLIGGVAGGDNVRDALPFLSAVRAYPTTIFLDADGRIHAVHAGFAGPATGDAHRETRALFTQHIETLLSSSGR